MRSALAGWRKPEKDLRRLARRDYVRPLRRHLEYRDVMAIVGAARRVWPRINRVRLKRGPVRKFADIAARLGLHFQSEPYTGPEGLALRGFYVEDSGPVLRQPLIYVNTAHHPGAVATTFCHELAHHLTRDILSSPRRKLHFFFDADYASHLDEPAELGADIVVSLAGYPAPLARRVFRTPWEWGLVARAAELPGDRLAKVRSHISKSYGLEFGEQIPQDQQLHYLAGMIHYAKLRWALLAEYDL